MNTGITDWAGITPKRWGELLQKLHEMGKTECTPAGLMRAIGDDINIGYREQIVLAYWIGYCQASGKKGMPVSMEALKLKRVMN